MSEAAVDAAPAVEVDQRWPMDAAVLADAMTQTRPFAGDRAASDRAWSARVDAAVQGMDVLDPAALDGWIERHAASAEPHLAEAELVAVWETAVRDAHADDARDHDASATAGAGDDGDEDGWSM